MMTWPAAAWARSRRTTCCFVSAAGDGARAGSRVTGMIEPVLVAGLDFLGAGRFGGRPRTSLVRMFVAGTGSNESVLARLTNIARLACRQSW